jgi:Fur family ferric uptake transcriptional regulator
MTKTATRSGQQGARRVAGGEFRLDGSVRERDISWAMGGVKAKAAHGDPDGTPPNLDHFRALLHEHMEKRGLRSTEQRKVIVETFFKAPHHVSIEELLAQVRQNDPRVGYATVYRTLKLLTECGVAYERRFGDGLTRYELADEESHHDHLICVDCGKIVEFEEPQIEELQERVAARHGFTVKSHKHEMYGTCAECNAKASRPAGMRAPLSDSRAPR